MTAQQNDAGADHGRGRVGDGGREPGGGGPGAAQPAVRHDPGADRGAHRAASACARATWCARPTRCRWSRSTRSSRSWCASRCRRPTCRPIQRYRAQRLAVAADPIGGGAPSEGTLAFVDNAVDTTTGTILLKGQLPEHRRRALAGRVRERPASALRRPGRARGAGLGRRLRAAGQLRVRGPARQHGGHAARSRSTAPPAISSSSARGVQPGDRVVTDGQLRLRQGVQGPDQGSGRQRPGGGIMNITGLFIRRPVMTTLVMAGILIFGLVAYRQLPVSDLPAVDYPTISVSASLPGREPRDHGLLGGDAAREAVLDHPRHRGDDVDQRPGQHPDHAPVRAEPQHRRGRAGRAGGDLPDAAPAPAGHAAAELPEGGPVVVADPVLRAPDRRRSRCRSSTSTPRRSWPSGSRPWTAWRRCRCTARRSTRCGSSSTPSSSRRGASGSTRSRRRSQNGNVNLPTGILWGTDKAYSVESHGQLTNAAGFGALVVAYRDGAPGAAGAISAR